jgi:hypothetical protein
MANHGPGVLADALAALLVEEVEPPRSERVGPARAARVHVRVAVVVCTASAAVQGAEKGVTLEGRDVRERAAREARGDQHLPERLGRVHRCAPSATGREERVLQEGRGGARRLRWPSARAKSNVCWYTFAKYAGSLRRRARSAGRRAASASGVSTLPCPISIRRT